MAFSENRISLIGNCVKDSELRYTPKGTPIANFTIAVNDSQYKGKDESGKAIYEDAVYFFRVVSWMMAEYLGKLKKGDKVYVTGKMTYRDYTPEGETESKRAWEVKADGVIPFRNLSSGSTTPSSSEDGYSPEPEAQTSDEIPSMNAKPKSKAEEVADDIPF